MPDVKRFHKGISDITHLKTNPPKLHSLMQKRTFYPRLQGKPAGPPGEARPWFRVPLLPPSGPELQGTQVPGLSQASLTAGEWRLSVPLAQGGRRMALCAWGSVTHNRLTQSLALQGGDTDPFYR